MAKKKKRVVPKRIAGVKVPKPLRRSLDELLSSPMGRNMVADAIVAAGAALIASQARKGSAARRFAEQHPPETLKADAEDAAAGVSNSGSALAYALGEASKTFAEALRRGKAAADARTAWPPVAGADPKASSESPAAAH